MNTTISVINIVWMALVGTMLMAAVSLHGTGNVKFAKNDITPVTAHSYMLVQK